MHSKSHSASPLASSSAFTDITGETHTSRQVKSTERATSSRHVGRAVHPDNSYIDLGLAMPFRGRTPELRPGGFL
jgi:hypothetical protein